MPPCRKPHPFRLTAIAFATLLFAGILHAAAGQTYYEVPEQPTDVTATTWLPWQVLRNSAGSYSLAEALPYPTRIDAAWRRGDGSWLLSVSDPTDLGSVTWEPRDVFAYDGAGTYTAFFDGSAEGVPAGSDVDAAFLTAAGNLVLSFDTPTTLGAVTYLPGDLAEHLGGGAFSMFFDASVAGLSDGTDLIAAGRTGSLTILAFYLPVTIGTTTWLPGQLVSWNGSILSTFDMQPAWPQNGGSRIAALAFAPPPGEVLPTVTVERISSTDVSISWTGSDCGGADDFGIYEGTIGSWYDHSLIDCTDDAGDHTETVTPAPGSRYFLVVAHNGGEEGSYGSGVGGSARPAGALTCAPTIATGCSP